MGESFQMKFCDFDDGGVSPIMDLLNFKVVKLDREENGFREEGKQHVTPEEKYYAEEYCRLNEQVENWKSLCEVKEKKITDLEKRVKLLEKDNDELKRKAVSLREVEPILEEKQHSLKAMELRHKRVEKELRNKLVHEKFTVKLKNKRIMDLEAELREVQKESQIIKKKQKDLSDFLARCNNSLEENMNSFVKEFNLALGDSESCDKTVEAGNDEDENDNELVHEKLQRNLFKLSQTFTEILAMGNKNNMR